MNKTKKAVLMILDGWGHGDKTRSDAIYNANTPFIDSLYEKYPNTELLTDGENVGLPQGQMGNSEVGHINIGAGRVVYQDLVKINKAIENRIIDKNPALNNAFQYAVKNKKDLHFMGLVSDGGIHSHHNHLYKLCDMAKEHDLRNVFIHAFTDGRDADPQSGIRFIAKLQEHLKKSTGKLASVCGRYYAMDRDKRWQRTKLAYDLLTKGEGKKTTEPLKAIQESHNNGVTDEFILPVSVENEGRPVAVIKNGDAVICFNFRTDRCRQITTALTQQDFSDHRMKKMDLHYTTMTTYNHSFKGINVVFEKDDLNMTLGEVLSKEGKKQIRISETEKYPHVTFFFSGGRENEFEGESRILIPSPKVATYDLKPEMSAREVTTAISMELEKGEADFVCLNFANADMVGHTGVYEAVIKAVETVDECAKKVVESGLKSGYSFVIIADHGNADYVINADGSPNTAHTTNPVPCFIIDKDVSKVRKGVLADVAPTILNIMKIKIPENMSGKALA